MAAFKYNYAVVCRVPNTLKYSTSAEADVDVELAKKEHRELIDTLKKCDVRVIELQEDDDYPECTFLEDCAFSIGGMALITRPAETTRHGEVAEIRKVLKQERSLNLRVYEIEDPDAIVNGGDIFFTGKEIFVGVGKAGTAGRTNERGANAVANAFPEYNVTPIRLTVNKRLKSLVCMAGKDIIAVGSSPAALNALQQIRGTAQYSYKILKLDGDSAVNMLYVNGRLIHKTRSEIGDKCYSILDEKITYCKHKVDLTEISKANGMLSSCVLFIDKHRIRKEIVSNISGNDLSMHTTTDEL